ncbi:transposase [Glaciecola siphonariae]|uniref:Transposase n=1 Tax=Glaciecola siphonariae TaxID=521012 RepID=A0ABV9M059_9ALTE
MPVHVVQRGNNRKACFFQASDYAVYLSKLKESAEKFNVKIHCFVLMTNHVHLLLQASDCEGISRVMQSLGRYFVRYINTTYNRTGTLWEGRFKSSLVNSDEYLLQVYQYIELNPVRAKMVNHPKDYVWSSYHANGGSKDIAMITPHPLYLSLSKDSESRKRAYNQLIREALPNEALDKIRLSISKSRVLGNDKFVEQISEQLKRFVGYLEHGGDRRSEEFKGWFQET